MLKSLFKRIDKLLVNQGKETSEEERFFSNMFGYAEIKKILLKSIVTKEPIHVLLTGPPSSSKTVFLLEMFEGLDNTFFIDAVSASGPGVVDHLFKEKTKYLLIDEIDKMKKNDQAVLLNVMETGILSETKLKGKTRQKKMKLWIFATSNDAEKLSKALRSRFMELHLNEYTYEQFIEIARQILNKKYHMKPEISEKIAFSVWNQMKSKDIRDAINIAKLTKSSDDIDWLVNVQMKYGRKKR